MNKLASLGASNPLALLEMRKASPEAFDAFVGEERARRIAEALESLLTEEERKRLVGSKTKRFRLGARLGRPPQSSQRN